jgi:hypothetical protein
VTVSTAAYFSHTDIAVAAEVIAPHRNIHREVFTKVFMTIDGVPFEEPQNNGAV